MSFTLNTWATAWVYFLHGKINNLAVKVNTQLNEIPTDCIFNKALSIKSDIKGGALTPKISVAYDVAYDTRYQTSYSIEGNAKDGFKIVAIALDGAEQLCRV